jgi:hypothetical protein
MIQIQAVKSLSGSCNSFKHKHISLKLNLIIDILSAMVCGIGVLLLLIIVGLLLGIYYLKRNKNKLNIETKKSNIKKSSSTFRNQKSNLYRTDVIKKYFNPPTTITDVTITYDENNAHHSSSSSPSTMRNVNYSQSNFNIQNQELEFNNQVIA